MPAPAGTPGLTRRCPLHPTSHCPGPYCPPALEKGFLWAALTWARSPFPILTPRSSGPWSPRPTQAPSGPGCPGGPTCQVESASSESLLRLSVPLPGGRRGERAGQVPAVLRSFSEPSPLGASRAGARASPSACKWAPQPRAGAAWSERWVGPERWASSPGFCALRHLLPPAAGPAGPQSHLGRAGQERTDRPFVSTYCVLGKGLGSLHKAILTQARPPASGWWSRQTSAGRWGEGSSQMAGPLPCPGGPDPVPAPVPLAPGQGWAASPAPAVPACECARTPLCLSHILSASLQLPAPPTTFPFSVLRV